MKEINDNDLEACFVDKQCKRECKRKNIYYDQMWFGNWIKGDMSDTCKYFKPNELKNKLHTLINK